MDETSKALVTRLLADPDFQSSCRGDVLDIGPGPDPLVLWHEHLPRMTSFTGYDVGDGDAQTLDGVPAEAFDFVYSSHCLEHVTHAPSALARWFEVVRPGGVLWVRVPDWYRYERGYWPSQGNADHKAAFVVGAPPRPVNVPMHDTLALAAQLGGEVLRVWRPSQGYRRQWPREVDQTLGLAHCEIELVVRKWTADDVAVGGAFPRVPA